MKDNEKPVLLGGVTYNETNSPYQLEADYDDYEDEKYLQRASILFDYPYEKEENTFIGLGEIPNDNITINYYYPNKPIESHVRDLRKEQDIIARQAKANRVYIPEKQNNQRIDYINKPLMNNGLTYTPNQEEIEMKPKKSIKQEKNYEEIANWFYPNMPEKSQIQETKRIPLLAENNQVPIKYYDDYPTLADRNYVAKPVQESFTGGAAKIPEAINTKNHEKNENVLPKIQNIKSEEEKNRDILKSLGLDENEYQIKGNTISRKDKVKDYEVINNVKYPNNTDNKKVEILRAVAKKDRSEKLREDNTKYLKRNAKLEQFGVDHVDNVKVKKIAKWWTKTDEAVENLHMSKTDSYLNTDYAKKHKVLNNYKEEPKYLHEYYQKKIPLQGENAEKIQGILIDSKSESSQKLKRSLINDSGFMDKIKKYSNAMCKGYAIEDSMDFEDKNWHNALGKADIVNMHRNKNGDIELDIVDVNNYNEGESNPMVQIGRDRQDNGEINPYFIRYHVIIPKDSKIHNKEYK